jgi:hypothetical protein
MGEMCDDWRGKQEAKKRKVNDKNGNPGEN